ETMKTFSYPVFLLCALFMLACSDRGQGSSPERLPGKSVSASTKPPNIVFILTDDLNKEVFSHSTRIPQLLATPGTTFANPFAYHCVSLSLCCPSRTATLRGQYAHNSGIFTNSGTNGGFATVYADGLESSTIATWLQAAGYRTALIGKYLNGYPTGAPSSTY